MVGVLGTAGVVLLNRLTQLMLVMSVPDSLTVKQKNSPQKNARLKQMRALMVRE